MKKLKFVTRFTNTFNKIKGIITGGSDSKTENESKRETIGLMEEKSLSEINSLHKNNRMMKKRIERRRMRSKMRRKTQQQQRF